MKKGPLIRKFPSITRSIDLNRSRHPVLFVTGRLKTWTQ